MKYNSADFLFLGHKCILIFEIKFKPGINIGTKIIQPDSLRLDRRDCGTFYNERKKRPFKDAFYVLNQ